MTTRGGRPVIGLVGAGGISRAHLPALLELGSAVLIFSAVGAPVLAAEYPSPPVPVEVVASLDELLDRSDVVDVVTPTFTHHDIVKAALEAGCDVVCEKPMARTSADAQELVDLAGARGLRLFPAHVVRYFPEYVALKGAVDRGRLGELAVLRFVRSGSFPTSPWFADVDASGGIVMDQMIHDLDQARWIAGPVRKVSALRVCTTADGHPLEAAHVILTHASGAISQCSGVWGPPNLEFVTEYSVSGTGGTLFHSSREENTYVAELQEVGSAGGYLPATDPAGSPYTLELRDYLGAIGGGPRPRVGATDGVEAVRIAEAALASAVTGRPVSLDGAVPQDVGERR